MHTASTQTRFFQHLKGRLPLHKALVEEVADLLGISTDSAYRRIRGEKPIDLEEVQTLAAHFRVSVDSLLNLPADALIFSGRPPAPAECTLGAWLANVLAQLQYIDSFGQRHVYFLVKDVLPFYHFLIPELAEFKMFFWMKSILHAEGLKGVRFAFGDARYQEHHAICQRIAAVYQQLPTTEIWNVESLNSTLRQIEFYREAGFFASPDDVGRLYEKLAELIDVLEYQAEQGTKGTPWQPVAGPPVPCRLFVNELIMGDNTCLAELDGQRLTILNHSVLYFVGTRDVAFNNFMFANLQNLLQKSTLVSGVGEKERSRFFNTLRHNLSAQVSR